MITSTRTVNIRPRILLSVHSAARGGAERMALAEAEYLKRQFDLVISVPRGPLTPCFARHGELTGGVASLPLWGASVGQWIARSVRTPDHAVRLARVIRRRRLELVLTNSSVSLAPLLAGRLAGVPVIVHARDVPGSRLAPLVFKLQGRFAHTVIIISGGLKPYFASAGKARVVELPEGIQPRVADSQTQLRHSRVAFHDPLRLCLVGSISPRKGQDIAVEALGYLSTAGVDATLDLIGRELDSGFAASLRQRAEHLDVAGRVRFIGELDDVRSHLKDADIVLAPSRAEWTPLVLMEAMTEQKPVVAANVGDVAEVVADQETGILIPPDDPRRLAGAIAELAADPAAAGRMGQRGRRRVEARFDIGQMLRALEREIHSALRIGDDGRLGR